MNAKLNNEPEESKYALVTVVYRGGAKVSFFARTFNVQRCDTHKELEAIEGRPISYIQSYEFTGVDFAEYKKLSKLVSNDCLVFAPLAVGSPEDMLAVFSTPITMPDDSLPF